jgi:hypothetical protein
MILKATFSRPETAEDVALELSRKKGWPDAFIKKELEQRFGQSEAENAMKRLKLSRHAEQRFGQLKEKLKTGN